MIPPVSYLIGELFGHMDRNSLELLVEASKVLNSTLNVPALVALVYDLIVAAIRLAAHRGDVMW